MIFPESLFQKLKSNEVHIWCTTLDERANYNFLFKYLNKDESINVNRFKLKVDSNNALAGKAITKYLLSYYLDKPFNKVELQYTRFNKPFVKDIFFNLSHSGNKIALAFCLNKEVGIDIEEIKGFSVMNQVAKSYFSHFEYGDYLKAKPNEKEALFYKIWTRKESFIKLLGDGTAYPLKDFTVDTNLDIKNSFVRIRNKISSIKIMDLDLFDNFAAALAIPPGHAKIIIKDFEIMNLYELALIREN